MHDRGVGRRVLAGVAALGLILTAAGSAVATAGPAGAAPAAPGQIVGWGLDGGGLGDFGLLGGSKVTVNSPIAAPAGALAGKVVTQVSLAGTHACALDSDGNAYCWGSDARGALGNGGAGAEDSTAPALVDVSALPAGTRWTQIDTGAFNETCALSTNGKAYCWGSGDGEGALGNGTISDSELPVAVDMSLVPGANPSFSSITVGETGACGLAAGRAYCWGGGLSWQMGNNLDDTANPRPTPVDASGVLAGKTLTQISGANVHTCALDTAGKAYCWGGRQFGAVLGAGPGPSDGSAVPVAVDSSGVLMGKTLTAISANSGGCVLDTEGKAYCWGPLGPGLGDNRDASGSFIASSPVAVSTAGVLAGKKLASIDESGNICAVDTDGVAYCWGYRAVGDGLPEDDDAGAAWVPVAVDATDALSGRAVSQVAVSDPTGATRGTARTTMLAVVASPVVAGTPTAPTVVTGQARDGQVAVSWSAPTDDGGSPITGYTATASPSGATCHPTSLVALTCAVTGLTNGTPYQFSVVATNASGDSVASAKSASVTPVGRPGRPTNVTIINVDAGQRVQWAVPASNGGSPITSYTVTAARTGGTAVACVPTTVALRQCVLTGLVGGASYSVTVSATNAIGTGEPSDPPTSLTAVTNPGIPLGVTATPGDGQVTVTWQAPTSDGGSPVASYRVFVVGRTSPACQVAAAGPLTCLVSGLTNGTSYPFAVIVLNVANLSAQSATVNAVPLAAPGAPSLQSATPQNRAVTLSWSAPTSTGGSPITGYTVTAAPGGATCVPVPATVTTCTISGLTNGTPYTFTVTARNANRVGPASNPASATPRTAPNPPTITLTTPGNGIVTITWTESSDGGSPIASYLVSSPTASGCVPVPATATTCVARGLTNGTAYQFRVRATNAAGSATSALSAGVTPRAALAIPTKPGPIEVLNPRPSRTTAFVDWNRVPGAAYYQIRIKRSTGSYGSWITVIEAQHTFRNLIFNAIYTVQVRAINRLGTGPTRATTFKQGSIRVN